VLLDVMLPGASGLDVLRGVRSAAPPHDALPVIMITARVEEVDRLLGLELGADDYICKPFSPREVVARVKTVLRRTRPAVPPAGLLLDAGHWRASIDGVALNLTRKEFELLQTLAQHPGRIYSRAVLLDRVYAADLDANERAIDSHIKNLRRKIAAVADGHDWIRSVYGVGFVLEPPTA
jgi:two-component system response regulator BaeR